MEGFNKIMTDIDKMVSSRMGFRKSLGMTAATNAPIIPPSRVGAKIGMMAGRSSAWCLSKPFTPTIHCRTMAMRFVPLATSAGRPSIIRAGKVKLDPPPARVFTAPAIKPAKTRRIAEVRDKSI